MKPDWPVLSIWVAALWWGGLSSVGFGVVPMLFAHLPTPAIAGAMAARLFSALTWLAVFCSVLLLFFNRAQATRASDHQKHKLLVFIVSGLLLALLSEFAVAPRIVARQDLRLWHSVGTLMYALQWWCATVTLKRLATGRLQGQ